MEQIFVLAILGLEHSGTTLVSRVFGAHSKAFSLGGLKNIQKFARNDRSCSCGVPLSQCDVWSGVITGLDLSADTKLGKQEKADLLRRLRDVTGSTLMVESSRKPEVTRDLADVPGITVIPMHVFKTPVQQMASAKRKRRPVFGELFKYIRRSREIRRSRFGGRAPIAIPYENFCATPEVYVQQVLSMTGEDLEANQIDAWGLTELHMLGGNRMKKQTDSTITNDVSYRETLSSFTIASGVLLGNMAYLKNKA